MEINLSVAIVSSGDNSDNRDKLIDQIGEQAIYQLFIDDGSIGYWENVKRAWRAHTEQATHHMVLHDTAILSNNLFEVAKRLIAYVNPNEPISLSDLLPSEMTLARNESIHWVTSTKVRSAECIIMPVTLIEPFIKFCDRFIRPDYPFDYGRFEIFLNKHRYAMWHSVPSVVGSSSGDTAFKFVGQNGEADPNVWDNLHLGVKAASLNMLHKWAIGETEGAVLSESDKLIVGDTVLTPFSEIIATVPDNQYVVPVNRTSNSLIVPCGGDDNPCK